MRNLDICRTAVSSHRKEPEVVQTSDQDAFWVPLLEVLETCPNGKRLWGQGKNSLKGLYTVYLLAKERLKIPQEELESIAGESDA